MWYNSKGLRVSQYYNACRLAIMIRDLLPGVNIVLENLSMPLPKFRTYFETHPSVEVAVLFGSYARGNAGPLSDLDIAVLFKAGLSKTERFLLRGDIAEDVRKIVAQTSGSRSKIGVDVIDLDSAPPLLKFEVFRDGEVLWATSDELLVGLRVDSIRKYLDTKPLRRVQAEYLVERLSQPSRKNDTRPEGGKVIW